MENSLTIKQDFTLLSLYMMDRTHDIGDRVCNYIDRQATDLERQITHDADWAGDVKRFYEKEIPYRLETSARHNLNSIADLISNGMSSNLIWLQNCLKAKGVREFNIPYRFQDDDLYSPCIEKLNLMDIHKAKLYARIGTLMIAICLSGFGMGAFIGSVLGGTVAEEILNSFADRSREKVKQVIPTIALNYSLQMKVYALKVLSEPNKLIINNLKSLCYELS